MLILFLFLIVGCNAFTGRWEVVTGTSQCNLAGKKKKKFFVKQCFDE